jgi:integrase/recombinase XerD
MASISKRGGKNGKSGAWYIRYFDETGRRRVVKGCNDHAATEQIARKLESDVALTKAGVIDPKAKRYAKEGRKPIASHLADFRNDMLARNVSDKQAQKVFFRVSKVLEYANIKYLNDMTPTVIQGAIGRIRDEGLSPKTCNDTLSAVKQFCSWAKRDGKIAENPISHLKGYNRELDRRHDRRALSEDELRRLIQVADNGPTLQKCPGPERALIYTFSALTGLRRSEIASLTKESFELDAEPPTVVVEAAFSKHRRRDTIPLATELVDDLRVFLEKKPIQKPVFHVPKKTSKAIQTDLEAAGIPFKTSQGYADFHALRHTYITRLIKAGVNPKTAQILARHSDPRLTLGVYTHIEIIDQAKALNSMPRLRENKEDRNGAEEESAEATGTDGEGHGNIGTKSVATIVASQETLPGKEGHSVARKKHRERGDKPSKKAPLGTERHPKAQSDKDVKDGGGGGSRTPVRCQDFRKIYMLRTGFNYPFRLPRSGSEPGFDCCFLTDEPQTRSPASRSGMAPHPRPKRPNQGGRDYSI